MTTVVTDGTNKLDSLHTDAAGNLRVAGTFSAEPPVGGATEAKQDTIISGLSAIDGHVDGLEGTLTTLNAKVPALGQALAAAAVPVVLTAIQVAAITPPAAITGFATETTLAAASAKLPASLGKKANSASLASTSKSGGDEYETVAASQTTQTIGATGAVGDYLEGILCVVATAATAQVQIKDGSNAAITVFPNSPGAGIGSYYIPLGLTSVQGAWQVTTGAGVSVIAMGDFT